MYHHYTTLYYYYDYRNTSNPKLTIFNSNIESQLDGFKVLRMFHKAHEFPESKKVRQTKLT